MTNAQITALLGTYRTPNGYAPQGIECISTQSGVTFWEGTITVPANAELPAGTYNVAWFLNGQVKAFSPRPQTQNPNRPAILLSLFAQEA